MNACWHHAPANTIRLGNTVELMGVIQEVSSVRINSEQQRVNINGNWFPLDASIEVYRAEPDA